jgi:hypothetical protein
MNTGVGRGARFLILAWILPATLSYMVYFGYCSNISGDVFSEPGFAAIYDQGIFKYRILGPALLRFVHTLVLDTALPAYAPEVLAAATPGLTPEFYSAFFYLNTLVLCLAASVLYLIVMRLEAAGSEVSANLLMLVLLGLMIFPQYVVVPYDMLTYLFLAIAIYQILWQPADTTRLILLSLVVILAALTRETAAIILSFYATIHFDALLHPSRSGSGGVSPRVSLVVLTLCFLAIYIGLRVWLGTGDTAFQKFRLDQNLTQNFSIVGALFFVSCVALALLNPRARRSSLLFMLASSPYWLMIFAVGNPREMRLWVPVLLPLLLIQVRGDIPAATHSRPA